MISDLLCPDCCDFSRSWWSSSLKRCSFRICSWRACCIRATSPSLAAFDASKLTLSSANCCKSRFCASSTGKRVLSMTAAVWRSFSSRCTSTLSRYCLNLASFACRISLVCAWYRVACSSNFVSPSYWPTFYIQVNFQYMSSNQPEPLEQLKFPPVLIVSAYAPTFLSAASSRPVGNNAIKWALCIYTPPVHIHDTSGSLPSFGGSLASGALQITWQCAAHPPRAAFSGHPTRRPCPGAGDQILP